jgi:acetyltransferase-like isoleucine patch superfamily enzyme
MKIIRNFIKLVLFKINYFVDSKVRDNKNSKTLLRHIFWNRILRINSHVYWPTHFTSQVGKIERMEIGKDVSPGYSPFCYIQTIGRLYIGDNTLIGPHVSIITGNHNISDLSTHKESFVRIGKNCWIGSHSVILPGVELADNIIVGAGSVVTKSFEEKNILIAGNPAKKLKKY